jgi:hypothetical protein
VSVVWINASTKNRFANKHLHVLQHAASVQQMLDAGRTIFHERVRASRRSRSAAVRELKQKYGSSRPPISTLLVFSIGGLMELEAAIERNNGRSGWYDIKNGAIFSVNNDQKIEGIAGRVDLRIRPLAGQSGKHEVYHLHGTNITTRLNVSAQAESQLTTMSFRPDQASLQSTKANLTHVNPPASNSPASLATLSPGLDLSFLDD